MNFKIGDIIEILDHFEFPKGKQYTIKNIKNCSSKDLYHCATCPGLIELEGVSRKSHCFGYLDEETNEDRYHCKLADFVLEIF